MEMQVKSFLHGSSILCLCYENKTNETITLWKIEICPNLMMMMTRRWRLLPWLWSISHSLPCVHFSWHCRESFYENGFLSYSVVTQFEQTSWSILLFAMGVWRNIQGVEIRDTICFDNRRFVKIRGPDILRFSLEIKCDRCWCFWWNIGKSQPIDFSSP